jgi:hypothetical protein
MARVGPGEPRPGPGVRLAQHGPQIVWIDVAVEDEAGRDINDLSCASEQQADAAFRKFYPDARLIGPESPD